jgi:GAF domain-containing protein
MADRLKLLEQKILRTVHDVLGFDNFEIRLLDRETGQLELVIAENISPLKIGEGHLCAPGRQWNLRLRGHHRRSYICPNVQQDPLYREGLDNAASSLTVPLMLHDKIIGTFNIESSKPDAFNQQDQRFRGSLWPLHRRGDEHPGHAGRGALHDQRAGLGKRRQ